MDEKRRFDEDAYENLRTLEVLAQVEAAKGLTKVEQLFNLLRFMTRLRREAPELFAQITEWAKRIKNEK